MSPTDTLHVYPAEDPHEPVYIQGTPDALRNLRDAIDRALASERPEYARTFAADGEGYILAVIPARDMTDAALHYATVRIEGGKWPVLNAADWDRMRTAIRAA